jgi:hypothetical protein
MYENSLEINNLIFPDKFANFFDTKIRGISNNKVYTGTKKFRLIIKCSWTPAQLNNV